MNEKILRLANNIIDKEGLTNTYIDGISFYKTSFSCPSSPVLFDLRVVFVLQGEKHIYIDNQVLKYNSENYLVTPITIPLDCETFASKEKPFIGLRIDIDKKIIHEILDSIKKENRSFKKKNLGVFTDRMNDNFEDAIFRLLTLLNQKEENRYLLNLLIKELLYKVALGENAYFLHKVFLSSNNESKIMRALKYIENNYNENIDIAELAKEEEMSQASFYSHFKEITSFTPLQYIKHIRLNKAKEYLPEFNYKISEVAYFIGYENPATFSRDFKKYFGCSPKSKK